MARREDNLKNCEQALNAATENFRRLKDQEASRALKVIIEDLIIALDSLKKELELQKSNKK